MSRPVLFRVPGRRGLGHVVRGLNIARAIRDRDPGVPCRFVCPGPAEPLVAGAGFALGAVGPPAVVVHDSTLRDADADPGAVRVLVLRRPSAERLGVLLADPALSGTALVLVPHTVAEFGHALPADLLPRVRFVGPIVRRPTPDRVRAARARYAADGRFLLVSTAGGGGFAEQADRFLDTVAAVDAALPPDVAHVVVAGPLYTGGRPRPLRATVLDAVPNLVDLLAAADLVVAEGGYNTVTEVRACGIPAVFLPGPRAWDDQEERTRALERRDLARVVTGGDTAARAREVLAAVADRAWQARARIRYALHPLVPGNAAAAAAILRLIDRR